MSQERFLILKMISEGKLSAEEGERLLEALDGNGSNGGFNGVNAVQNFFTQATRNAQKGLKKAGEVLRERQDDLRKHIENLTRKNDEADESGRGAHTVTIEVEEEEEPA